MQSTTRVSYRGIAPSREVNATITEQMERLADFAQLISDCHVELEHWRRHHDQGTSYRVAIEVLLPHRAVKVARESELNASREVLAQLLGSAFAGIERAIASIVQDPLLGRHVHVLSDEARRLHALHGDAPKVL